MVALQDLREIPLFADLSELRLQWLQANLEDMRVEAGAVLRSEGETFRGFFVILDGEIVASRLIDGQQMPVRRYVAPGFCGAVPLLAGTPSLTTLKAESDSHLVRLSEPVLRELLACCDSFSKIIFRATAERLTNLEALLRTREKMAALGKLAAGLAHELNNPAAALARMTDRANEVREALDESLHALSLSSIPHEAIEVIHALSARACAKARQAPGDDLARAAAESRLGDWLAAHGVEKPWLVAPGLIAGGIVRDDIAALGESLAPHQFNVSIRWLGATIELHALLKDATGSATHISDMVKALKAYAYMDRAPQQEVDIHDGIEDTLAIMRHRLIRSVAVRREYDRSLPRLQAYGSELNQVWTNIVDNAVDAMEGRGDLVISTRREGDYAVVEFTDSGPGIPPEIQSRLFEPFFTTKPVGQGTGLGLDIAYRIVVNRHGGTILVSSQPGATTFHIRLPLPAQAIAR
ncbi:ATP-binding protein [Paraburkholderia terrae]|uniref:sensor histidine kinase n=1 Tax=Paraburkholderia terrae TaxID=311230 RepID=UPI0030E500DE